MHRWAWIALLVCLLAIFGATAVCEEDLSQNRVNVIDDLNYLTKDEIIDLQESINKISADNQLDAVIVITDKTDGKSSMEYADDYYDSNGFGVGDDHSGLLLLVNMAKREVWISTTGKAIDIFTDGRIAEMVSHTTSFLKNGNYDEACKAFIEDVRTNVNLGVPPGQHRVDTGSALAPTYFDKVKRLMGTPWVYFVSILVSIIATLMVSKMSKGKVTVTSRTYEEAGSFVLTENRDEYIRESTSRTKIVTESSSSDNSSSTHSSSSGSTHGGGGGSF